MELFALNCNHCGAKLKVKETAKFVTCRHCDTQLAIHHGDGAAYTDVVAAAQRVEASAKALEQHASSLGDQSELLIVQNDLERLEREWEERMSEWMSEGKDGRLHAPTKGRAIGIAIVAPLCLFPVVLAPEMGSFNGWLWFIGLASVGVLEWLALRLWTQAERYERGRAVHERERAGLMSKLDRLRAGRRKKRKKK